MPVSRQLADASPVLLWTVRDDDGTCVYFNHEWRVFCGEDLASTPAIGFAHLVHEGDHDAAQSVLRHQTGHYVETILRLRRVDGMFRWFKVVARRVETTQGVLWHGVNMDITEFKVAESVTATNEPFVEFVRAQRVAKTGSWSYDLRTGVVRWSAELFRIFRLPPAGVAVAYEQQERLFSPSSWASLQHAVARASSEGIAYDLVLEIVRTTGELGFAEARGEAIFDDNGVAMLIGTFQDVTEREQTAAALRETTERLTLARAAAGFGIWEWSTRTDSMMWDDGMYMLYGVDRGAFSGAADAWRSALHPDDIARTTAEVTSGVAAGGTFEFHFRIVRPDATVRHIRAFALVLGDDSGRVIGVNQDITEQRLAELQLQQSEALQRAVLDYAGPMIVATDVDGTIKLWNHAAEDMLGYAAGEMIGRHSLAALHLTDELDRRRPGLEQALQMPLPTPFCVCVAVARNNGLDASEWTYLRRDGSALPVLVTTTVLRGDDGRISGFLAVAVDLTERRAAETHLVELNKLLEDRSRQREVLLQEVHHRVKNNLQVIASLMNLQLRKLEEPAARIALAECRSRVQSIALIHEQLYTSRDYARVPFDDYAAQLSRNVVAAAADPSRITLRMKVEPITLGVDKAIPAGLILNELLTNALKHAFPDGRRGAITVELSHREEHVVLVVADDGVGGAASSIRNERSLGLQIVNTLVRQLDGALHVVGTDGTRSTITFPEGAT